jgi:hypothetical protein
MDTECKVCRGARRVCEGHPDKPWDGLSFHPNYRLGIRVCGIWLGQAGKLDWFENVNEVL